LLASFGCAPQVRSGTSRSAGRKTVDFAFSGIDGQVVSDESTRGRVTVILFAATYDLDSQTQAKTLEDLYRMHAPRLNAVLVFLEAPQYVELARSFRDVLRLSYPVALGDQEDIRAGGRFPPVYAVPTWVILDRSSVVQAVHEGALDSADLRKLAEAAE
jgi:hypothetical protein